jgi:hypothetical protein
LLRLRRNDSDAALRLTFVFLFGVAMSAVEKSTGAEARSSLGSIGTTEVVP